MNIKTSIQLLDISQIKKIDKNEMYKIYDEWPQIAESSFLKESNSLNQIKIEHIVFSGMGGSGAIGDVLASILSKSRIRVDVIKGYLLPPTVNSKTLVINTSISGNTIETLTVLKTAHKKKCRILTFTSGGKLEKYCKKNNLEFYKIPMNHSPRASFVGFLYRMIKFLKPILPINDKDIFESIKYLKIYKQKISSKNLTKQNPALNLAIWLPKIPLIYYPAGLQSSAIRFKNSLQENAKMHVIAEDVIEACHNGIVSWSKKSGVKPILIQGKNDYSKTKEREKILKRFFKNNGIEYYEIFSVNGNILSKLICLIYMLDYVSIYSAIISKIDPTPVEPIDFIKNNI